jgi:hypothetical protein
MLSWRNISICLLTALICFTACNSPKQAQQTESTKSIRWQNDTLTIDGDDADWVKPLSYFDEQLALQFAFSNDRDNLYIMASSNNKSTMQRILRAGLTLFINIHGVKQESGSAAISFPTGNRVVKDGKMLNDRLELLQNNHVALTNVEDYSLFGFHQIKIAENYNYGKPNKAGVELAIGINQRQELIYEISVPLLSLLSASEINSLTRNSIAIGISIEQLPELSGSGSSGGGSLSVGAGMGTYGSGGGVGLSFGIPIGGNRKNMDKPIKLWKEITLAK